MSGSIHPIADALEQAVRNHRAASPEDQAENLAHIGGFIVGAGASLAIHFGPHAHDFSTGIKFGFAAVMVVGLALIITGWRRRGQRNLVGAVTALLVPGIGYYLTVTYVPGVFHLWWAQAFGIGIITAHVIASALCLAGRSNRAFGLVAEDIANNEWRW
jgi:ABC-type uncharacterized transport system permease subunit